MSHHVIVRGHRIRTTKKLVAGVPPGASMVLAVRDLDRFRDRLAEVGFTAHLQAGERVLPSAVGPRTRYNAEGDYEVHKDRPKEVAYRQIEWTWREFRGRYDYVEKTEIRDVPYERYPRTFRPPPSAELTIVRNAEGSPLVVSDPLTNDPASADVLLHVANVFLELFGEVETLTEGLSTYVAGNIRRLNWTVLPRGHHPWPALRTRLEPYVVRAPQGNRPVLMHRLEEINSHRPQFTAVGHGGFSGYIVFGFPDKGVYVLESLYYGNATYVFGAAWESLSQKSKAEVLAGNLEQKRIIHRRGWDAAIRALLAD